MGTSKHWPGATVFWQVDISGRVRTGKVMLYNPENGRRIKEPHNYITWVHSLLKKENFNLRQCLFSEHLLSSYQMKRTYPLPINRIIQLISSLKTYFDLVLIDTDMASTDTPAKLMELSDLALLITDDTECSIKNNQRFRRFLTQKQISYDHMHVIAYQIRKEQRMYSDQEIEELLHIPVLVTLPYNDQVWKYNNSYLSLYEDSENLLHPSLSSLVNRLSKLLEK